MDPNPELETRFESYLFDEMPPDARAAFEKEMAADPSLRLQFEARKEQARLMRRAFLRQQIQKSKAEFGALDLPETVAGREAKTVSLFPRYAVAAGLALALGGAAWWMWSQGEKTQSEIAATRTKTEALQKELAEKEAENRQKSLENAASEPLSIAKEPAAQLEKSPKSQRPIAQNQPQKGEPRAAQPQIYSSEKPAIRGDLNIKKGKGNAIFESLGAKPDLEKARIAQPALVKKIEQKRWAEVLETLSKASIEDKNAGYYLSAVCYFERGELSKSIAELDSLYFSNNPYFAEAKWLMALCRLREEKLDAAKKLLTDISKTKNHPNQAIATEALSKF